MADLTSEEVAALVAEHPDSPFYTITVSWDGPGEPGGVEYPVKRGFTPDDEAIDWLLASIGAHVRRLLR
jgi:hypothetical protein